MPRPLLPPTYINVPAGIVYDKRISPVVLHTYVQIRGMAWGNEDNETPELSVQKLIEITGKSRATIYGHLAILRDSGWLLFSSAHHSGLTVRFISNAVHDLTLSRNLDSLNEDVNLTDLSLTKIIKHPPVNQKNRADSVQISGQESKNLDRNNGWHDVIDADLEDLLTRVGVYKDKFNAIADSGWTPWQIEKLAETVLNELGPGQGGGVFIWRFENLPAPQTAEQTADKLRQEWRESLEDWGDLVQH